MGSKQKSQQKLPRQNSKVFKQAQRGAPKAHNESRRGFRGYRPTPVGSNHTSDAE